MIIQYPYKLFIQATNGGSFDNDGFANPDSSDETFISVCRDEPANSGDIVTTDAGEKTSYKNKIYMPLGDYFLEPNTKVHIIDKDGNTRLKMPVIRFAKNQLHCVIWV